MSAFMTSTRPKTKEDCMQEWETLFPNFSTLEGSCLFIKKLIAVSLSFITYMRRIFPERAYGERNLKGLRVKLLTEDCGIKSVLKFINAIRSCYDAVEKKYLQQMSIGICPDPENKDEVVEAYNLVFRYTEGECSITRNDETEKISFRNNPTAEATFLMLKSIYTICEGLGDLPKNAYIVMKLLYYDDITPPDYEPEGFKPSSTIKFTFSEKTTNIKFGNVETDNHKFQLLLKTTFFGSQLSQCVSEGTSSNSVPLLTLKHEVPRKSVFENLEPSQSSSIQTESILGVMCPCEQTSGNDSTIRCASCDKMQHKYCYGILKPEDIPDIFYCADCILHNSDIPLDLVYTYHGKERQEFCSMRRALALCLNLKSLTISHFEKQLGCTKATAKDLLERLEFEGYVSKSSKNRYTVEKLKIYKYGLPHYFSSKENKNEFSECDKNEMDTIPDSPVLSNLHSEEHSTRTLESPIRKITALSLRDKSSVAVNHLSRKRKSSSHDIISPARSDDVFQTKKRTRTQRKISK